MSNKRLNCFDDGFFEPKTPMPLPEESFYDVDDAKSSESFYELVSESPNDDEEKFTPRPRFIPRPQKRTMFTDASPRFIPRPRFTRPTDAEERFTRPRTTDAEERFTHPQKRSARFTHPQKRPRTTDAQERFTPGTPRPPERFTPPVFKKPNAVPKVRIRPVSFNCTKQLSPDSAALYQSKFPKLPPKKILDRWISGKQITYHKSIVAVLSVTKFGFTLSNGVKSVSEDGQSLENSKIAKEVYDMCVNKIFLFDEFTEKKWKDIKQSNQLMFEKLKDYRILPPSPEQQIKDRNSRCFYCKNELCHRWNATILGISRILDIEVDPIRHFSYKKF